MHIFNDKLLLSNYVAYIDNINNNNYSRDIHFRHS